MRLTSVVTTWIGLCDVINGKASVLGSGDKVFAFFPFFFPFLTTVNPVTSSSFSGWAICSLFVGAKLSGELRTLVLVPFDCGLGSSNGVGSGGSEDLGLLIGMPGISPTCCLSASVMVRNFFKPHESRIDCRRHKELAHWCFTFSSRNSVSMLKLRGKHIIMMILASCQYLQLGYWVQSRRQERKQEYSLQGNVDQKLGNPKTRSSQYFTIECLVTYGSSRLIKFWPKIDGEMQDHGIGTHLCVFKFSLK